MTTKTLKTVAMTINGERRELAVDPNESLLDLLRRSGLKGVKRGCSEGSCGTCTVTMDGKAVYSCILPAFQASGRSIETVEGAGDFDRPHPFQEALVETGGVQCGFCIPGFVMAAKALLDKNPKPSACKSKEYLDGVLCRCTGYVKIWEAFKRVAGITDSGEGKGGR